MSLGCSVAAWCSRKRKIWLYFTVWIMITLGENSKFCGLSTDASTGITMIFTLKIYIARLTLTIQNVFTTLKIRFVFVFYIKNYLIATLIVSWSKLLTVRCPKKTVLICFQFYKKKKEKKIGKTCLKSSLQIEITFLEQDGPLRLLPFINFLVQF